jgi:VIT1/CCC1 family predicted Fe2+/Mn2+ transporter
MLNQENIKALIIKHSQRLQLLKEQQAVAGAFTDPAITIEIENIETEIEKLQAGLKQSEEVKVSSQIKNPGSSGTVQKESSGVGNFFRGMVTNTGVMGEIIQFLWARKLWWLIPMVTVLLLFGLLLIFASSSGVAPFIYTLF